MRILPPKPPPTTAEPEERSPPAGASPGDATRGDRGRGGGEGGRRGSGSRGRARAWVGRAVDLRPGELPAVVEAFAYFFFLLASYYILRPLRDEMAIAGGVARLPSLFTLTLAVMLVAVPAWSALVARLPVRRLIPIVYRFCVLNLGVFFVVFRRGGDHARAAQVFFVWTSVFNLFVVSVFWSFMADRFSERQGRRLFGFIAAGGSAGAIFGPALTSVLVSRIGPVHLLWVAAGLLEAASQCARRLASSGWRPDGGAEGRPAPTGVSAAEATEDAAPQARATAAAAGVRGAGGPGAEPSEVTPDGQGQAAVDGGKAIGGGTWAAIHLLLRSRYLLGIAAYVLLLTSTSTFGYMMQARVVADQHLSSAARTHLFARIDLWVNVGSVIAQALLAGKVMSRFGIGPALALAPVLTIGTAAWLGVAPTLAVLIGAQTVRRIAEYAVTKPAREVLYTVVTREEKYKPKTLIDTVVYRGGDAAASWTFASLLAHGASLAATAWLSLPLAVLWLALAGWLARSHAVRARGAAGWVDGPSGPARRRAP